MNNLSGHFTKSPFEGEGAGNMAGETGWRLMVEDLTCYAKELGLDSIGNKDLSLTAEQFLSCLKG